MSEWYESIHFAEKIKYIFEGTSPFDEMQIDDIIIHQRIFYLRFISKKLPKKYPQKWKEKNFNAILFTVEFTDLISIQIDADNFFEKNIDISVTAKDEKKAVLISGNNLAIKILCQHIILNEVQAIHYNHHQPEI